MTQDDKNARLKKAWQRRFNEMLKAGFSEAMARMEADDYLETLTKHLEGDIL
jgi:tRNA A37 N6-isopentenylltransferase MiaA